MLTVSLDYNSKKSLYIQLYESIKEQIIKKQLDSNSRLPSKRALSMHLGVSIKTVENAYSQLLLEGYILSKERKGFFVNSIEDFRTGKKESKKFVSSYRDDEYAVDLQSNRNAIEEFPISTWCKTMREILSYKDEKLFETVPFNGIAPLRIEIAKFLHEFRGMEVSPDQIVVGAGTEYMYSRLIQMFDRNTSYAVEDPGYKMIRALYKSNGVSFKAIPVDDEGIRVDELEKTDCSLVHVSPAQQFPLGSVMPINRRLELLQWVNKKPGRYIIEDDYDSEYRLHGVSVAPIYSIDIRSKVIYMNTFSKSVAPAVRISYMVLPEELMKKYIDTMSFYSCTVSSFEQYTLARFMEEGFLERHIHRMKRHNVLQRKMAMEELENSSIKDKIEIVKDTAGSVFLLKVKTNLSDKILIKKLAAKKIKVSCLNDYCQSPKEKYKSVLLVNYSNVSKDQIKYFIEAMEEIIG